MAEPLTRARSGPAAALAWLCALAGCGAAPPEVPPAPFEPPPAPAVVPDAAPAPPPALLQRSRLANGLSVMALRYEPSLARTAEVSFAVLAGTRTGKQGLADFAAELVAHSSDLTAGRPPLAAAIGELGGVLTVELGPLSTWFTVRVPVERWREAVAALARGVRGPHGGRSQLVRLQEEMLARRSAAVAAAPERKVVERFLLGDEGSADHLLALQARDPSEVAVFLARHYRPEHSVLSLHVPGDVADIGRAAGLGFADWRPPEVARDPQREPADRLLRSGVHWAPGGGPDRCRVLAVFGLPDPVSPLAPAVHLLLHCITMDGVGGRLEHLQVEAGLGDLTWEPMSVHCGEAAARVLATTAAPERIAALWRVLEAARRSLVEVPPTSSEREIAAGRAWLSLHHQEALDATAMRARTTAVIRNLDPSQRSAHLAALARSSAIEPAAVELFAALPLAMLVIGGPEPDGPGEVRTFAVLPEGFLAATAGAAADKPVAAAGPHLQRALRALGGAERLERIVGLSWTAATATDGAPELREQVDWSLAGDLRLRRTVLGTTVETKIAGERWTEQVGEQQHELSPLEAGWRLAEIERHPLLLLIRCAQGRLQPRLLSVRPIDGREHVMLEIEAQHCQRLRLLVDRESGLPRLVEAWTTSPGGEPSHTLDAWSDYRSVGGLRVPFRRETTVDDGESRRTTDFETFEVLRRR